MIRKEREGFVVLRLNEQYPMFFESCSIFWNDKEYRMNGFQHIGIGNTMNTMVISTDLLEISELPMFDLRYSLSDDILETYMFISDYENVFFENNGRSLLKLKIGKEEYELEAGPFSYLILPKE